MATNAAAGLGFVEIGGIAVDVKDHVGGTESDFGVGVGGTVVEELVDGEIGVFCGFCLFVGNGAEGHQEGDVHTAGVVEDGANDLLDSSDAFFVEAR